MSRYVTYKFFYNNNQWSINVKLKMSGCQGLFFFTIGSFLK